MKHHRLRTFLAVAEHRSIHAAARALFVSQPVVTRTMRELDVPLLRRSVSGVELTEAGQAFQMRASLLVEDMRRAREELQFMKEGANGHVAVALTSTLGLTLLPLALEAFLQRMPRARLTVSEDTVPTALRKLQDGTLDFSITNTQPGSLGAEFDQQPLFEMLLLMAARRRAPAAVRVRGVGGSQPGDAEKPPDDADGAVPDRLPARAAAAGGHAARRGLSPAPGPRQTALRRAS